MSLNVLVYCLSPVAYRMPIYNFKSDLPEKCLNQNRAGLPFYSVGEVFIELFVYNLANLCEDSAQLCGIARRSKF